jgi:hypothetical protein
MKLLFLSDILVRQSTVHDDFCGTEVGDGGTQILSSIANILIAAELKLRGKRKQR